MNLANLDALRLKIEWPKRPSRRRSQIHAGWKHRHRGDRQQVEFLAGEEDAVIEESLSTGRVRRVRLGHGKIHEYDPCWHDLLLRCIDLVDDWRDRRVERQVIRRRKARHMKMHLEMERRLRTPAFICHLPSHLLR